MTMKPTNDDTDPALAMVFPGQGSQSVGMLSELARAFPQVRKTYQEAGDVLGYDLGALVMEGPEAELNRTDCTQPAMLAAGVAVWRIWRSQGGRRPAVMAGHSLGEYTALVCADAMSFADAVALVAERGRCMQEAVPAGSGAMAAILGLADADVVDVCARAAEGGVVAAVNFNSPGQVVIAGDTAAVHRAMDLAKASGAKRVVPLPVSVPSHCELMRPAAARFAAQLERTAIRPPAIPVIQNVDVTAQDAPDAIREALKRQLYSPVQWVKTIETMRAAGIARIVEAGPGKVLAGLCKRIHRELEAVAVYDPDSLSAALAA
jgi:[acyl-carrier-protein] S-malonyltransferase